MVGLWKGNPARISLTRDAKGLSGWPAEAVCVERMPMVEWCVGDGDRKDDWEAMQKIVLHAVDAHNATHGWYITCNGDKPWKMVIVHNDAMGGIARMTGGRIPPYVNIDGTNLICIQCTL